MEDAARQFDAPAKLACVDQIAVVCNGKIALNVRNGNRLRVFARLLACGRVADVADRHRTGHRVQRGLIEHLADQTDIFVAMDDTAVVDRDTGRLLPAMLQSKECNIRLVRGRNFLSGRCGDAEHAALLVYLIKWGISVL